ncbi:MAG TPA: acetolactate synthase small subunit [Candidatus Binatia bacterium]|nr:acetolactate synthase small subunit [Candidatus Binatia bacterium]
MRHTISVLVENEFGVLAKISGLFSGRGFNIESLCVAETTDPTVSRITLVTSGDDRVLEQITKHLNKLVNVIKVCDFGAVGHVERELVLVKVAADPRTRGEVLSVVNIFRGKVVDVADRSYVVEVTGTSDKVRAFIDLLKPFGILELVRTGVVALYRGSQVLSGDVREEKPAVAVDAGHEGRIAREGSEADFI